MLLNVCGTRIGKYYCHTYKYYKQGFINLPSTVEPVLRDHCHERPPILKDPIFLAEGPTFQWN